MSLEERVEQLAARLASERIARKALEARIERVERPWLLLIANSTAALAIGGSVIARYLFGAH